MKEIQNFKELKEKVEFGSLGEELMKDIVFQLYIFENCFEEGAINKVVILEEDEDYPIPDLACELEETICNYNKQLFILSNSGEGLIVYKKQQKDK